MTQTISVPNLTTPTRLDKFLVQELKNSWSRTAIQKAIEQGKITVNKNQVPVHHFLKAGEIISIDPKPANINHTKTQVELPIAIIAETSDYIILEKPYGLVVHPAAGVHEATLTDWLAQQYPEISSVGDDPTRPGIVHRLDREVSGLMVVARTPDMFETLKLQFKNRQIFKKYIALVVGHLAQSAGTINFPLARSSRRHGKMAARPKAADDTHEAITHYEVQHQYQAVALLSIRLETGRTHQIRAHLGALGHPLVGDNLYRPKNLTFKHTPGRLFLHASKLGFKDASGQLQNFFSPLPKILENFLTTLA